MSQIFAATALLPDGWAENVLITLDGAGAIESVKTQAACPKDAERAGGPVIPAMPNLHSHAFQRAMAGLAERAGTGEASFWGWRDVMYRFVDLLEPEDVQAIAAQLYVEMLKAGYGWVGEFHYIHHQPDGTPYDNRAELSARVIGAADEAGIGITHLPVLYACGGFGGQAPDDGQRRFINAPDDLLGMIETLRGQNGDNPRLRLGIAPHSLRAVTPDMLDAAVAGLTAQDATAPIHIHIAEQTREVDECVAHTGKRPVRWLLDNADIDGRWCLVHATHMDGGETAGLAESGAVAGLCPATEANLGDGLFNLSGYHEKRGRWGIGSDSHISVSVVEELRILEYGQRLNKRVRTVYAGAGQAHNGAALLCDALAGGAQAMAAPTGRIAAGVQADLVVLDHERNPNLYGRRGNALLDAMVFAGNAPVARHVMAGGQWVVREGRHIREDDIFRRFTASMDRLVSNGGL